MCTPATRCARSNGAQVYRQVREIRERSRSQEVVYVRQGGLKPPGERRVIDGADERIEPDQSMAASLQSSYFFAEDLRVAPIPSVGDEEDHWRLMEHATCPSLVELPQRGPDPRAARPVGYRIRHGVDRFLHAAKANLSRHAGEACREEEDFEPAAPVRHAMSEVQEHA